MLPGYKIDRAYSKVDRSRHATCTILADISMPKLFQGVQQHQHEPTKSPWSYIWAHHLSHAAPGRRRPRNQSSPTRYLLVGAMYSKCASGKVIKYILPGGRMHDNHWLLRNWIKLKDLQQRHRKFSLQIWCKKFTGIYTWDGCAIYGKHSATKTPKWAANAHIVVSWPNASLKRVFVEIWLSWPYLYSTSIHKLYK